MARKAPRPRRRAPAPPQRWWHDKDHPAWWAAKVGVITVGLFAYLLVTAHDFNHDEIEEILVTLILTAGSRAIGPRT